MTNTIEEINKKINDIYNGLLSNKNAPILNKIHTRLQSTVIYLNKFISESGCEAAELEQLSSSLNGYIEEFSKLLNPKQNWATCDLKAKNNTQALIGAFTSIARVILTTVTQHQTIIFSKVDNFKKEFAKLKETEINWDDAADIAILTKTAKAPNDIHQNFLHFCVIEHIRSGLAAFYIWLEALASSLDDPEKYSRYPTNEPMILIATEQLSKLYYNLTAKQPKYASIIYTLEANFLNKNVNSNLAKLTIDLNSAFTKTGIMRFDKGTLLISTINNILRDEKLNELEKNYQLIKAVQQTYNNYKQSISNNEKLSEQFIRIIEYEKTICKQQQLLKEVKATLNLTKQETTTVKLEQKRIQKLIDKLYKYSIALLHFDDDNKKLSKIILNHIDDWHYQWQKKGIFQIISDIDKLRKNISKYDKPDSYQCRKLLLKFTNKLLIIYSQNEHLTIQSKLFSLKHSILTDILNMNKEVYFAKLAHRNSSQNLPKESLQLLNYLKRIKLKCNEILTTDLNQPKNFAIDNYRVTKTEPNMLFRKCNSFNYVSQENTMTLFSEKPEINDPLCDQIGCSRKEAMLAINKKFNPTAYSSFLNISRDQKYCDISKLSNAFNVKIIIWQDGAKITIEEEFNPEQEKTIHLLHTSEKNFLDIMEPMFCKEQKTEQTQSPAKANTF